LLRLNQPEKRETSPTMQSKLDLMPITMLMSKPNQPERKEILPITPSKLVSMPTIMLMPKLQSQQLKRLLKELLLIEPEMRLLSHLLMNTPPVSRIEDTHSSTTHLLRPNQPEKRETSHTTPSMPGLTPITMLILPRPNQPEKRETSHTMRSMPDLTPITMLILPRPNQPEKRETSLTTPSKLVLMPTTTLMSNSKLIQLSRKLLPHSPPKE
jgi:hypothetical protein